jgi:hypothetical protein
MQGFGGVILKSASLSTFSALIHSIIFTTIFCVASLTKIFLQLNFCCGFVDSPVYLGFDFTAAGIPENAESVIDPFYMWLAINNIQVAVFG